jgi:hypothetical protein
MRLIVKFHFKEITGRWINWWNYASATTLKGALFCCAVLAFVLVSSKASATGGISGSKLATPSADTIPALKMEFEPYFSLRYDLRDLDSGWRRNDLNLKHKAFEAGYRFTVGLINNLEAGLVLPVVFEKEWNEEQRLSGTGLGDIPLGLKWNFLFRDAFTFAWHGGVTAPTGHSDVGEDELPTGTGAVLTETGLIGTILPTENLSIDANLMLGLGWPVNDFGDKSLDLTFELAVGYAFGNFQLVLELNQTHSFGELHPASLFSLNTGFTWELNPQVIIVTGPRYDFAGKNQREAIAYNLAFTILLQPNPFASL